MSSENIFDFTIVGAGLCGLSLGWDLAEKFSSLNFQIVEKSKGSGGRLATRRIEDRRFDHGAQFIKRTEVSDPWIDIWRGADVLLPFPYEGKSRFCGHNGMTQLTKYLARRLPVNYNNKLVSLKSSVGIWTLKNDQGIESLARNVVLTSPLPQSLEILKNSGLDFDHRLSEIHYSSALVLLLQAEQDFSALPVYQEDVGGGLFSICSQHSKGTSQGFAWTVVMDAQWSQIHFEMEENQILENACKLIRQRLPKLLFGHVHLKKWRYCQPLKTWPHLFESPAPNLYLAGDSFGGPSLLGALRSSRGLVEHLLKITA
jgi:renalase